MEEISKRIKQLISDKGLSNSVFAQSLDLNPSIISHILSGRNKVSLQVVMLIKEHYPEVDLDWLLTGTRSSHPMQMVQTEFTNVNSNSASNLSSTSTPRELEKVKDNRQIEQVIILYSDKSMESYRP